MISTIKNIYEKYHWIHVKTKHELPYVNHPNLPKNTASENYLSIIHQIEHCKLYSKKHISYRNLPIKYIDYTSKEYNGLTKNPCDNATVICAHNQIDTIVREYIDLLKDISELFDLRFSIEIFSKPKHHCGSNDDWAMLKDILESSNINFTHTDQIGYFAGPSMQSSFINQNNEQYKCPIFQIDFVLASKENLKFHTSNNTHQRPIVIYFSICQSFESLAAFLNVK